ncbi:hypothetical protein CQW29_11860 [Pantoea coffeiphila]|uniref:Uncharacterized protein n=1 Tax=Pantoea coffeiphila TaxID=1465635 RepID=A0A2S9IBQ9_9GAMM|nr:hypothetical protein CQW29_11860 [Pantoea coffeiphila]
MTNQRIRFFAMSLKGLTSYYNCVNRQRRVLHILHTWNRCKTAAADPAMMVTVCALSLQCTLHANENVKRPAYEFLLS